MSFIPKAPQNGTLYPVSLALLNSKKSTFYV
jgi:hypothetical protein